MKKICLIVLIALLFCGCKNSNKTEVISFYVNTKGESYMYGDLVVEVLQIDGDCVSGSKCQSDEDITIFVSAGIEEKMNDYVLSNNSDYVKIKETNDYLKLKVVNGKATITVYE